jgi:putative photosynthetic complex assembly protein 2
VTAPAWPLLLTLLLWWGSTGAILFLASRRGLRGPAIWGATVLAGAAVAGLVASRDDASAAGAYCAFACGLLVWGWIETSWLTGHVTGPRRAQVPCPEGASTGRRFLLGIATGLYHELAVVAVGCTLFALTADAANPIGAWTFGVLWIMRWSAKLNLFLGVPNLNAEFFPPHLRFLSTYVRRRSMNLLFPISVTVPAIAAGALVHQGLASPDPLVQVGGLCLGTLLALAVLEHWFMVLPLRDAELWRWALPRERRTSAEAAPELSTTPAAP